MSFNTIRENKILAKISESTVLTINQYAIGILAVKERNGGTAKPV